MSEYLPQASRSEGRSRSWRHVRSRLTIAAIAGILILASCGPAEEPDATEPEPEETVPDEQPAEEPEEDAAPDTEGLRVGMALLGPQDDQGFFQGHYEGLTQAADTYGLDVTIVENVTDPARQLDTLRTMAETMDIVIGGSAIFAEPAATLAPDFPDVTFIISAGVLTPEQDFPNLHAYLVRQGVGSYVIGALAAELTQSNEVSFIGGPVLPPLQQGVIGYEAGAKSVNPDIRVAETFTGSFGDVAAAQEAGEAQIAAGVDVIYTFLNPSTPGVFQAIEDSGQDVRMMLPEFTTPSVRCAQSDAMVAVKFFDAPRIIDTMIRDYVDGNLPDGTQFYGLEDPDIQRVELCPNYSGPDADRLQEIIDDITAGIVSGEIQLPPDV